MVHVVKNFWICQHQIWLCPDSNCLSHSTFIFITIYCSSSYAMNNWRAIYNISICIYNLQVSSFRILIVDVLPLSLLKREHPFKITFILQFLLHILYVEQEIRGAWTSLKIILNFAVALPLSIYFWNTVSEQSEIRPAMVGFFPWHFFIAFRDCISCSHCSSSP